MLIKVGASVGVKSPNNKELIPATIKKIQDCSLYTVGNINLSFYYFRIVVKKIFDYFSRKNKKILLLT